MMSEFQEWFNKEPLPKSGEAMAKFMHKLNWELTQAAWNHQQEKIAKLEAALEDIASLWWLESDRPDHGDILSIITKALKKD